jgi:hypothetical protein
MDMFNKIPENLTIDSQKPIKMAPAQHLLASFGLIRFFSHCIFPQLVLKVYT